MSIVTKTYKYGEGMILPQNVVKEGNDFLGWYDNSSLTGNSISSIGTNEEGDKYFYAKWRYKQMVVFEKDGTDGTLTGTIKLSPGKYRITISAGGGLDGYAVRLYSDLASGKSGDIATSLWTAGSGGGAYGIWVLAEDADVNYQVGTVGVDSFVGPFHCTAGGSVIDALASGGTILDIKVGVAGSVSGLEQFSQYATAGGNAGNYAAGATSALNGGASVLLYTDDTGGDQFPRIDLQWGRGCSVGIPTENPYIGALSNNDAVAGYLKIEKIS